MCNVYYRPQWTCGRYNKEKNVALIYNLIEGMSYFFEDESAYIVGQIIQTPKKQELILNSIEKIDCTNEEINSFLEELVSLGLLTKQLLDNDSIKEYRLKTRKLRFEENLINQNEDDTKDNAESLYVKACGENYISSMMLELTYRCSEKCIHCYNPGATRNNSEKNSRGDRDELSLSDYKRVIDELYNIGTFRVCLSGGDPFSNKYVWEIIDYLYQKDFAIDIYTNGQRLSDKIDILAGYYPHTMGISLYSGVPQVHDSITRIKGSYKKTMSVIEQCSMWGIPIKLKCCIMLNNVQSYHTLKEIARGYNTIVEFELNITDSLDGDVCASKMLRLPREIMEVVFRDKDLSYYIGEKGLRECNINGEDIICGAGINTFCLTPEGFLEPCCSFPMFLGNIKDSTIREILQNSSDYNWWKSLRVKHLEECYTHDYCCCCEMCVGNNFIANGNPLKPSPNNCDLAKWRFSLSNKLLGGNDVLNGKSVEERLNDFDIKIPKLHRMKTENYRKKG